MNQETFYQYPDVQQSPISTTRKATTTATTATTTTTTTTTTRQKPRRPWSPLKWPWAGRRKRSSGVKLPFFLIEKLFGELFSYLFSSMNH